MYKAYLAKRVSSTIIAAPKILQSYKYKHTSLALEQLNLLPIVAWDKDLKNAWNLAEQQAHRLQTTIIHRILTGYSTQGDYHQLTRPLIYLHIYISVRLPHNEKYTV